ncbi:hypothetical protein PROP_00329 [Propionicimonas sp. T2.31MG-18]|uniref:right-handed parallel beta-helix repeat-containing protein n=1 Tax=Propionicimonas sp. T2.31MG-18 TaxID=3157620 RepID=UPI0035EF57D1
MHVFRTRSRVFTAVVAGLVTGLVAAIVPTQESSAATLALSSSVPGSAAAALAPSYAAPAGALYVATNGSDTNAGTLAAPFKTLYKAMTTVKAGGTVVVRGGVYRQGASATSGYNIGGTYYFTPVPSGVTIQNYPGETVWFDGTEPVTSWTKVSSTDYKVSWSTPDLCAQKYYTRAPSNQAADGPCSYSDALGAGASLGDPQMVFRNGTQLTQAASLSAMTANSFYYDWANKVMHIGFDPAGNSVELTKYAQGMALYKPTNFALKGIGFRRYASNQIRNATASAVLVNGGSNVLFENSAFVENAGAGVQAWQTTNLTFRRSVLSSNGANGLNYDGNWSARSTVPTDNVTIEYSRLDGNNADAYGVNCSWACGAAAAKLTGTYGMTVRYSSLSNNGGQRASGFWCDLGCKNLTMYGNVVKGNARHGLVYEISDKAIVASNLFVDNGWNSPAYGGGYGMYLGSAHVRVYNNTMVNNRAAIGVYDDARQATTNTGGFAAARIGPDTVGTEIVNNIITGGSSDNGRHVMISGGDLKYAGNTTATQAMSVMSNNSYYQAPTGDSKYWTSWNEKVGATTEVYSSVAAFQTAKKLEQSSQLSNATTNPYLASTSTGDYRVVSGSGADGSAKALPSDIAALFASGVNTGDRGVITLDGQTVTAAGAGTSTPTPTPTPTPTTASPTPTPTATTPAAGTTSIAAADFGTAVASGWGSATTGGAWTTSGTGFSVSGGVGKLALAASSTRSAMLGSTSGRDVDATVELSLDKVPAGGQAHVNLDLRKGTDGAYRAKVRFAKTGAVSVVLAKVVGSTEYTLGAATVSGLTYSPGKKLTLGFQATGTGTTTLKTRLWVTGQAQPSSWLLTTTDTQPTLQDAGAVGVAAWVEASTTNAPITVGMDNLAVVKTP